MVCSKYPATSLVNSADPQTRSRRLSPTGADQFFKQVLVQAAKGSCPGNSRGAAPGVLLGDERASGGDSWASSEFTQSAPLCQTRNLEPEGWGKHASPSPTTGQVLPSTWTQVTSREACGPVSTGEAQGGGGMSLGHMMMWGSRGIRLGVPSFPLPPRGCCP